MWNYFQLLRGVVFFLIVGSEGSYENKGPSDQLVQAIE